MNTHHTRIDKTSWKRYLLRRFGHPAIHSRRTQRSQLLRRMMFTARKSI